MKSSLTLHVRVRMNFELNTIALFNSKGLFHNNHKFNVRVTASTTLWSSGIGTFLYPFSHNYTIDSELSHTHKEAHVLHKLTY